MFRFTVNHLYSISIVKALSVYHQNATKHKHSWLCHLYRSSEILRFTVVCCRSHAQTACRTKDFIVDASTTNDFADLVSPEFKLPKGCSFFQDCCFCCFRQDDVHSCDKFYTDVFFSRWPVPVLLLFFLHGLFLFISGRMIFTCALAIVPTLFFSLYFRPDDFHLCSCYCSHIVFFSLFQAGWSVPGAWPGHAARSDAGGVRGGAPAGAAPGRVRRGALHPAQAVQLLPLPHPRQTVRRKFFFSHLQFIPNSLKVSSSEGNMKPGFRFLE